MSCPVWELPDFDREHWDLHFLCGWMDCAECTAEPGEMPWLPDDPDRAEPEARRDS